MPSSSPLGHRLQLEQGCHEQLFLLLPTLSLLFSSAELSTCFPSAEPHWHRENVLSPVFPFLSSAPEHCGGGFLPSPISPMAQGRLGGELVFFLTS